MQHTTKELQNGLSLVFEKKEFRVKLVMSLAVSRKIFRLSNLEAYLNQFG